MAVYVTCVHVLGYGLMIPFFSPRDVFFVSRSARHYNDIEWTIYMSRIVKLLNEW
jgi:hypothetical protein